VYLAIVDVTTAAADRPAALAQLEAEAGTVRAMPGCLAFRAFPSPESDTELTILHEWLDAASFEGYTASESFAASGAVLRPLMTATPRSRRFRAELVETVA
jgi:quinol monooxygenase YgiN